MKKWQRRTLGCLVVLGLPALVISLPFWNTYEMTLGEKIAWWVIFGGAVIAMWVILWRELPGRRHPYWGQSVSQAGLGPRVDWQEWFGGFYWLEIELWVGPWYAGLEITNRPPDPDM